MHNLTLIMLGAGNSTRFDMPVKKQWLRIGSIPLWLFVTNKLKSYYSFEKVIITALDEDIKYMKKYAKFDFIKGGNTRQESLKNALSLVETEYVLVSDIARACISSDMFFRIIEAAKYADCIVPTLMVSDTVIYDEDTINREKVKLVQTPQLSNTKALINALQSNIEFTDESSAIKANGGSIWYVKGDKMAHKITYFDDLKQLNLKSPSNEIFIGNGFDVHEFEQNKPMILGAIKVHESLGLKAHSDGDVLIHALCDAILGAISYGDIGELFPDNDDKYKNISSVILLEYVCKFVRNVGYEFVNCDITIIAQTPKISPFKDKMTEKITEVLQIEPIRVNIKATTTEKLGFIGRKEGLAVLASASLKFFDWKSDENSYS